MLSLSTPFVYPSFILTNKMIENDFFNIVSDVRILSHGFCGFEDSEITIYLSFSLHSDRVNFSTSIWLVIWVPSLTNISTSSLLSQCISCNNSNSSNRHGWPAADLNPKSIRNWCNHLDHNLDADLLPWMFLFNLAYVPPLYPWYVSSGKSFENTT